jgi:hypothetical protein
MVAATSVRRRFLGNFDKPRLVCSSQLVLPHLGHNSVSKRLSVSITVGFDPPRRVGTQAAFADCPGGGTNASAIADLLSPTQAPLRRGAFSCHNAEEGYCSRALFGVPPIPSNSALSPVSAGLFLWCGVVRACRDPDNRQCSPGSGLPVHLWSMTNFTARSEFFRDMSSAQPGTFS